MKLSIYALRDEKAGYFGTPFYSHNDNTARRIVADLKADTNSTVGRHPEDFRLFRLGTYDDQSGVIEYNNPDFIQETTT